jgi:putative salt-induced outer membrane protein YdiY
MKRLITGLVLTSVLLGLFSAPVLADEVVLKNGDKLTGTIGQIAGGTISFTSPILGALTIKLTDVKSYKTEKPATVQLKNGQTFKSPIVTGTTTQITTADHQTTPLKVVKSVNPPAEKWTGSVVINGALERGNTNNASVGIAANAVLRRDDPVYDDRFTLGANYNYLKSGKGSDATTTTDNWSGLAKYDRFFSTSWYGYVGTGYLHDRIAGIETQVTPGIGTGYQWIEQPNLNFNTEGGANYVYQDLKGAGVDQTADFRLAYHVDAKLNPTVSIFHDVEFLAPFQDPADYLINADAGIRADLTKNFFSQLKVVYHRNDFPASGFVKDDVSFLLGIGWAF